MPPYFATRSEDAEWLVDKIDLIGKSNQIVQSDFVIKPGTDLPITFRIENDGGDANPFYFDVSYSSGLSLINYPSDMTVIPPDTLIWQKDDVDEPTLFFHRLPCRDCK